MPRKRKSEPIGIGYTAKQMRKKKPINNEYLVDITPPVSYTHLTLPTKA